MELFYLIIRVNNDQPACVVFKSKQEIESYIDKHQYHGTLLPIDEKVYYIKVRV